MKTILIDSDVCLDVYLDRLPFYNESAELLQNVEDSVFTGVISALSFANLHYILGRYANKQKAIGHISMLRGYTKVGAINTKIFDNALKSNWNDFEDAMQRFCAVEEGCEAIITRNTADYKQSELPVYTPAEFLKKI